MTLIRKWLLLGCAVFCMFGLTACKKDEEPSKVNMTKEEFYQKLLILDSKLNSTSQYTINGETKMSMLMFSETSTYKISMDVDNNKYAKEEKNEDGDITKSEYVVKNGNDYIRYSYEVMTYNDEDEYIYESSYVGSDYVERTMYNENVINLKDIDMSSYDAFCESFDSMLVSSNEELASLNVDSLDTKVEIYEENDIYHFSYSVSYSTTENGEKASANISATLSFNEEFLVSMDMDAKITYGSGLEKMTMKIKSSNKYSKGFDNNMMPTDWSAYPQEIENAEFEVYYNLDGEEDYLGTDYTYSPGEIFIPEYDDEIIDNAHIDGWYLDENCTISVDYLTEYPSYDLHLYGKTKPNDNYALIIIEESITMEDDWTYGPHVTKTTVAAGEAFVIPTTVEIYGNEGVVTSVTVDGAAYNGSTLTVENGKIYRVVVSAVEQNN